MGSRNVEYLKIAPRNRRFMASGQKQTRLFQHSLTSLPRRSVLRLEQMSSISLKSKYIFSVEIMEAKLTVNIAAG